MFAAFLTLMVSGIPTPAPQSATKPSVASARMVSQNQFQLRWHGVGDLRASTQMCVTSTTGRFQLEIQPVSVSTGRASAPDFEIIVSTRAGDRAVQKARSTGLLMFEGRTLQDDCLGTGNVTIELRFQREGLTETLAGEYLERIQISVRPA